MSDGALRGWGWRACRCPVPCLNACGGEALPRAALGFSVSAAHSALVWAHSADSASAARAPLRPSPLSMMSLHRQACW